MPWGEGVCARALCSIVVRTTSRQALSIGTSHCQTSRSRDSAESHQRKEEEEIQLQSIACSQ
jgi:hypothetical protein